MTTVIKALKWAYSDTIPSLLFMLSFAGVVGYLMTLIAYPIETLTWTILGLIAWVMFSFFSSL